MTRIPGSALQAATVLLLETPASSARGRFGPRSRKAGVAILLRFLLPLALLAPLSAQTPGRVSSRGLDIHYQIDGKGEPLLILGGGPGDVAARYHELFHLLSRHARCILVEQRGTGASTPKVKDATTLNLAATLEDFEAIRKQLGLKQWTVLGFSYGGYLASLYAETFPESLSSLVLLGSMGLNWEGSGVFEDHIQSRLWGSDLEQVALWSAPERLKADRQKAITEIIKAKFPGYFFDRKKALTEAARTRPEHFDFEIGEWIYKDALARNLDLARQPSQFQGPVLVLHGRQDPTGESVPLELAKHYAKARLRFIERCGHYSWLEHPDQVVAAVAEFLTPATQRDAQGTAWVRVDAGRFRMGSREGRPDEGPERDVILTQPILMAATPVTVGQFRHFVQATGFRTTAERGKGAWVWDAKKKDWAQKRSASWRAPGFAQTDDHPVVCVSWDDAQAYCAWIGHQLDSICRLPTEAEFEYAIRAGTRTPWFFGPQTGGFESYGWPQPLTPQGFPTHPVGQKRPNPWGLQDLVGSVWQWCGDWYDPKGYSGAATRDPGGPARGEARVNRGGMGDDPEAWRSARRDALSPEANYSNQGFRIVRELIRPR